MSESLRQIAVLFARQDSIYKTLPGCDVWDIERDARNWTGGCPVVAHPPCRAWGRLRAFAKPRHDEKELAMLAVDHVRQFGGVLEHPAASTLWDAAGLPRPGSSGRDKFGGWSIQVPQFWFGHRAYKSTWLYFVGIDPKELPDIPLVLGEAPCTVGLFSGRDRARCRKEISKREREATPPAFADWLCRVPRGSFVRAERVAA